VLATDSNAIGVILWRNLMTKARDLSQSPNATFSFKNRLIDAGFIINQRGYTSGTSLSSGAYAHDRWKAGSSGCTYTFTQGSLGVPITLTITAGSLQQIIEGCNMAEGGGFVLSWTGTAQARINGGSYSASPLVVTGLTAGANCTVEFGTGTVSQPQLEKGSTATSFDYRPYGTELALCQRYCVVWKSTRAYAGAYIGRIGSSSSASFFAPGNFRAAPTITSSGTLLVNGTTANGVVSGFPVVDLGGNGIAFITDTNAVMTAGQGTVLLDGGSNNTSITFNAEL
jgi:hypothetical protein